VRRSAQRGMQYVRCSVVRCSSSAQVRACAVRIVRVCAEKLMNAVRVRGAAQ